MSWLLVGIVLVRHPQLARADQAAVLAGQAHGLAAEAVDHRHQLALHFTGEDPLDDFHRLGIGDAHALDERRFLADALQRLVDLRAAAVDHDRIHADQLEQHDVVRERFLQVLVDHRVAAVLHDDRLAVEAPDIRQRLGQDFGLQSAGRSARCPWRRWLSGWAMDEGKPGGGAARRANLTPRHRRSTSGSRARAVPPHRKPVASSISSAFVRATPLPHPARTDPCSRNSGLTACTATDASPA